MPKYLKELHYKKPPTPPAWGIFNAKINKKYMELPKEEFEKLPESESFVDTKARVAEYWEKEVVPGLEEVQDGNSVLIVAQDSAIRSIL